MSESTLTQSLKDLYGAVGRFLGYGRGELNNDTMWSQAQKADVEEVIKSGYRQFLFPPPAGGSGSSYDWSFLQPTATLTLASGSQTIQLPDDFGEPQGPVTMTSAASTIPWQIPIRGEGVIRQMFQQLPDATGRPEMIAFQPIKGTQPTHGQRYQAYVFPAADGDYQITLRYYVLADALKESLPFAYGGMAHSETIREACLMAAEQFLDDTAGVHTMKFQERLAASISLDRRMKPEVIGYNGDRSDMREWGRLRQHGLSPITFDGVQY